MVSNQIFKLYEKKTLRIRKIEKEFVRKRDFKDIKFPVKIKDIHKIEKKCVSISVFGYENTENFQSTFQ